MERKRKTNNFYRLLQELYPDHQNFKNEQNNWQNGSLKLKEIKMIKLADQDFVNKLKALSNSSNRYAQIKAKWLLGKILHHRKDLELDSLEP